MAETQARGMYGIHDVRIYNRTTWASVAYFRILGTVTSSFEAEIVDLKGGSNNFIWDSAIAAFGSTISIVSKEVTSDIVTATLDATTTEYGADSSGDIIDEANQVGTSVSDAAQGIATITVKAGAADELKEGWYRAVATAAATVDIYALSSGNFGRGTNEAYEDDDGKVNPTAVTIPASGSTVDVDNFGLTLTGGSSSAIALTTSDSMIFYVQKPHGIGTFSSVIGNSSLDFQDRGLVISSETNGGIITMMRFPRVKIAGWAAPFEEKGFGEASITATVMHDSAENAIAVYRRSTPE